MSKGGSQRVVSLLSKYMFRRSSPEIHLIMIEDIIEYTIPQRVKIKSICNSTKSPLLHTLFLPIYALRLKRYCKKHNINLIMSFLYRANYLNVLAAIFGSDHNAVLSERTTASVTYSGFSFQNILSRFLIYKLYRRAYSIIAVSDGVKQDLYQNFSISLNKIRRIYNPFNIEEIKHKSKEKVKEVWLLKSQHKVIIGIGRLIKDKRFDNFLNALQRFHQQNENIRAIILGDGPQKRKLKKLAKTLKISHLVKFVGIVDNPFAYLSRADLMVSTSVREGFPNAVVEAMICGCPVISTDCKSGPGEIIVQKQNGILVPKADVEKIVKAVKKILADDESREMYINNAKIRVQVFALKNIIPQYEDVIRQVI